ncbi:MAG TPA: ATP-binding domain-containing protein, partial [Polyangiaceae bacterium]
FAAVTAAADTSLLVLGTAGSGKTTVALHRLARIAHQQPKEFPLRECGVIVPEEGLARLARRLLAPVGAKAEQVQTLDHWAITLATAVFGRLPPRCSDAPGVVVSLKRHPALYMALREQFQTLKPNQLTWRSLRRRLSELFSDRGFLSNVVARSHGGIASSAIEETVRHTMHQLADPVSVQLAQITDPRMKQALDGQALDVGSAEELAGTVDVEELPIILFLKAWRDGIAASHLAHLVIDEAEDMSPFELYVLGTLLREPISVTLAGDEAQQTHSSFRSWDFSLECLGLPSAPICRLMTSYRCPRPVTLLAQRVLGHLASGDAIATAREGAPVGRFQFDVESQADLFVVESVMELCRAEPEASIAIVLCSAEAATRFHALFREPGDARLILEGDFGFDAGIDVTHVDSVKGLEFDYVVLPDVSAKHYPETDDARRRLHVAITRTAHQLWLVSAGEGSPLVDSCSLGRT